MSSVCNFLKLTTAAKCRLDEFIADNSCSELVLRGAEMSYSGGFPYVASCELIKEYSKLRSAWVVYHTYGLLFIISTAC